MARALKVLFVEDSDNDAALLLRELHKGGYEPDYARVETAQELETSLQETRWDIVISDYSMPSFDGIAALKIVRKHNQDVPFIIVSANIGEEIAIMAMKAGAQDYIMKGNLKRLLPAIEREINESTIRKKHRMAEEDMRKLSSAIEQTADVVIITDKRGKIEYVNTAFVNITGYKKDEVIGKYPNILKSGEHDKTFYNSLWSAIQSKKSFQDVFINKRKDGTVYYEEKTISPLIDEEGNIENFISTGKDVTSQIKTQERLQHITHHDLLTGLPNRSLFIDRLNQAIARAKWNKRVISVLFFDLDRFKNINETLGHSHGDALLLQVSERLMHCVREGDSVARLGDDEFAIVLEDVAKKEDIPHVTEKIMRQMSAPYKIDDIELYATTSIGISVYPGDGDDGDMLLQNADVALHHAKEAGSNLYRFYTAEMNSQSLYRLNMESSLRHGLERNEFVLHYQPQFETRTGKIIGAEALIRWQHPELGMVAPNEFIGLLEETGMIIHVGMWVLQSACMQGQKWNEEHNAGLRVSVNISPVQFNHPGLVDSVKEALETSGLPAELLELELTESTVMRDPLTAANTLQEFNDMGVRIAIDDFGTGYSSLSYLQKFPLDTLKIDRSFISGVEHNNGNASIVSAIISMAHNLKMEVVAEGVEIEDQADFLRLHECEIMQGFLLSKPIRPNELLALYYKTNGSPSGDTVIPLITSPT
jgi:diguanylate cyclase (GGDEF)-like protein/PAS domain S-box-containing protein